MSLIDNLFLVIFLLTNNDPLIMILTNNDRVISTEFWNLYFKQKYSGGKYRVFQLFFSFYSSYWFNFNIMQNNDLQISKIDN